MKQLRKLISKAEDINSDIARVCETLERLDIDEFEDELRIAHEISFVYFNDFKWDLLTDDLEHSEKFVKEVNAMWEKDEQLVHTLCSYYTSKLDKGKALKPKTMKLLLAMTEKRLQEQVRWNLKDLQETEDA